MLIESGSDITIYIELIFNGVNRNKSLPCAWHSHGYNDDFDITLHFTWGLELCIDLVISGCFVQIGFSLSLVASSVDLL